MSNIDSKNDKIEDNKTTLSPQSTKSETIESKLEESEIKTLAEKHHWYYFYSSAKTGQNINEIFQKSIDLIVSSGELNLNSN